MNANKTTARIAGVLYLTIIMSGIFAHFFVRAGLIVSGDATATANNIMASESLFRIGIGADLIMILCDVAVALIFYVLLKPVSDGLALLAAFFRLVQAAILAMNLLNLFLALQLLTGADYLSALGAEQVQAQAYLFLDAHSAGYALALVFFGIQCLVLGYLITVSGYFPRILGALLIFAGVGYLIDSFAGLLLPSYGLYAETFALIVLVPALIGELALSLWLLLKGVDAQQVDNRFSVPAAQAEGLATQ